MGNAGGPDSNPLENHPKWKQLEYVNKGSFGFVVKAQNRETGEVVAIKFVQIQ